MKSGVGKHKHATTGVDQAPRRFSGVRHSLLESRPALAVSGAFLDRGWSSAIVGTLGTGAVCLAFVILSGVLTEARVPPATHLRGPATPSSRSADARLARKSKHGATEVVVRAERAVLEHWGAAVQRRPQKYQCGDWGPWSLDTRSLTSEEMWDTASLQLCLYRWRPNMEEGGLRACRTRANTTAFGGTLKNSTLQLSLSLPCESLQCFCN